MPLRPPEGDWPPPPGPLAARLAPDRVLTRMAAVPDVEMREALWREVLTALPAASVLPIIAAVREALAAGQLAGRLAWLALIRTLEPLRGTPTALALFLEARAAGDPSTGQLLLEPPPARRAEAHHLPRPPQDRDREITLGERRAWARRPDRDRLQRLLYDPDPGVIGNLLNNPRLTEPDVLKIASRRPTAAAALQTVFTHPRWGRRRPVQLALIQNPYTPVDTACGLVALLDRSQIRALAGEPGLHPMIRATAEILCGGVGEGRPEAVTPEAVAPEAVTPEAVTPEAVTSASTEPAAPPPDQAPADDEG